MTRSDGGKPLYLVTEISEAAADTAASGVISRGTPVDTRNFPDTFGLFAFGIGGASWTEGGTEKTSYENMEVKKGTNGVWMPQTETLWQWPGKGQIDFYAYSPRIGESSPVLPPAEEPADGGDENAPAGEQELSFSYSVGEDNKPVLAYTVPSDVTKQIDLMTARVDCAGDGSESAHLTFSHALTAVTIKTGAEMLKGTIKSVTISGVYGEGTYQIGADGWTIPQKAEKRKFVVTLGNDSKPDATNEEPDTDTGKGSGMYQDKDTPIVEDEYTFMMIPQTLPEGATLTVVFTDEFSQTEWILTADLKDQKWPMGKMVTYSINSTGIVVKPVVTLTVNRDGLWPNGGLKELENTQTIDGGLYGDEMTEAEKDAYLPVSGYLRGVEMSAFVQMAQADKQTVKLPLTCTIEYSTDKKDWSSQLKDSKPVWTPVSSEASRSEPDEVKKGAIRLPAQEVFNDTREKLLGITPVESSEDNYYDLVENNPFQKESANCYMVHTPGYYKFPAAYGNTYRNYTDANIERAYKYQGRLNEEGVLGDYVLQHFVGYDDEPINVTDKSTIPDIDNAVIIWQDSPDLVTDVYLKKDGWVHFRILEETINQGNAVIAVRNSNGTILWSWHIWVTHHYWTESHTQMSSAKNEEGQNFLFAPCNLGYCDPHDGNPKRSVYMRLTATMPGMTEPEVLKTVKVEGMPAPDKDGIFEFAQPKIVASIAGDNTYYQWGRKDPMLPGVYDETIRTQTPGKIEVTYSEQTKTIDYTGQLDMENKMFYSIPDYKFTSRETSQSIGESIQYPYCFFIHKRPATNTTDDKNHKDDNYKRRHWHNGENIDNRHTSYKQKTIMNFWNSQLDKSGTKESIEAPNQMYVRKTIYDPAPAGYKIPPPTAFSGFFEITNNKIDIASAEFEDSSNTGWYIIDKEKRTKFFFPSTGVRDMGLYQRESAYGTWPAHSRLTFIATSGFQGGIDDDGSSCMLFSIDGRPNPNTTNGINGVNALYGTNNAYGFTLRPVRDHQHGAGTR
ncbi:fimbrillin family protein [uncultured Bacteroides sp.]|uniref:fimbrillin family protein n=1 Tax=uncultured Bacteroides sp. TaxID=162156 RepID=UPI0025B1D112|nr:fimbrillin family protein [uncultured Bacteroides sp.]